MYSVAAADGVALKAQATPVKFRALYKSPIRNSQSGKIYYTTVILQASR